MSSDQQRCQYSGHPTYGSGDATKISQWHHKDCHRLVQYPVCDGCFTRLSTAPAIRCAGCRELLSVGANHITLLAVL